MDRDNIVTKIRLRKSFDNEPYVRYTRMEASFWAKFVGRSLDELSRLDADQEGIEGVSGATMTSMATVKILRAAASQHLSELQATEADSVTTVRWNWSWGELATATVALLGLVWSFSSWRGKRGLRLMWQIMVMVAIVGMSGNLISVALMAGWTNAIPKIALAPGLVLLLVVAVLAPILFRRNVYCDHICPHGIVQQWIASGMRTRQSKTSGSQAKTDESSADASKANESRSSDRPARSRLPDWLQRALQVTAWLVIACAIGWLIWRKPAQLTVFEPFDAYAWRIGLSSSLLVGVVSLLLAARQPMGYCRLACPTGKLLDTLRRKKVDRPFNAVAWLVALNIVAWMMLSFVQTH